MVEHHGADPTLLDSYENERRPVALSVIDSSGELVRATKYSDQGTHATDYVKIVERRAGNITGMGIRYGGEGLEGSRLHDFEYQTEGRTTRAYSNLDYTKFTLFLFGETEQEIEVPDFVRVVKIESENAPSEYQGKAVLTRPDAYIQAVAPLQNTEELTKKLQPASSPFSFR